MRNQPTKKPRNPQVLATSRARTAESGGEEDRVGERGMRGGARGSGGNGVHGEAEQLVSTRLALVCEFVRVVDEVALFESIFF